MYGLGGGGVIALRISSYYFSFFNHKIKIIFVYKVWNGDGSVGKSDWAVG